MRLRNKPPIGISTDFSKKQGHDRKSFAESFFHEIGIPVFSEVEIGFLELSPPFKINH